MKWTWRKERQAAEVALPALEVLHHAAIHPFAEGDERLSASIGPDGELLAVWATPHNADFLQGTTNRGLAVFPDATPPRPASVRVTTHAPDVVSTVHLTDLRISHPKAQPLPGGRLLLVGARARWRPEGPDRNAVVHDADGRLLVEETLGDGIQHVLTSATGDVWVGYFDEGVFGNYGWGDVGAPEPLGVCGLARFTADLRPDWRFPQWEGHGWDGITDCYALNVTGDTAWTCYYTEFPIVRVQDGGLSGWSNDVEGAKALAVGGSRVALVGGYGDDRDRLIVGDLAGTRLDVTGGFRLTLPGGEPLPARRQVVGRGADLHLITEDGWYRLDPENIPAG